MLTDTALRKLKPTDKTTRLFDAHGLYLEVTPAGGRYWRMKYRFGGKEKRLALGVYPAVTLAKARAETLAARELIAARTDPGETRKAEKQRAAGVDSFEAVAREWHVKFAPQWSTTHANKLMRRLELHVFPFIGRKPVAELTAADVLPLLRKPEERGELETAHGVRVVVGQVCRYAVATGLAANDPTPALRGAIQANKAAHMAALTDPREVGALMRAIADYKGGPIVRTALLVSALTFQRPGNVRAMEWSEVNLDAALWTIPAAKMKRVKAEKENGAPHLVPLSAHAVAALRALHTVTGHGRLVFPGERSHDRPISENTVTTALRCMGYRRDQMVAHGFRAMARTLLDEVLEEPVDVIEAQLAHKVRDALGTAYNRTSHIERRRAMMQRWADYLQKLAAGGEVIVLPVRVA